MPDSDKTPTPQVVQPGHQKPTKYYPRRQWTPAFSPEGSKGSLPIGWKCPCGYGVHTELGKVTCPKCGRIARDSTSMKKLDSSQRCTTGRQGRKWKAVGRGGRV
jgi:hypothetical protein